MAIARSCCGAIAPHAKWSCSPAAVFADPQHALDIGVEHHRGISMPLNLQGVHRTEVKLRHTARHVLLREHHLLLRTLLHLPCLDVPPQGPQLAFLVASGKSLAEQGEERLGLPGRIALQLGFDPRPVICKGILAGAMLARLLLQAGQLAGRSYLRTVRSLMPVRAAASFWLAPFLRSSSNDLISPSFFIPPPSGSGMVKRGPARLRTVPLNRRI